MTIVNEIDEENSKNNRTIDTETGVYLKETKYSAKEHEMFFSVTDGETVFNIYAEAWSEFNESREVLNCTYKAINIDFYGAPKRKNYCELIMRLIEQYGWHYRSGEKKYGHRVYAKFGLKPLALEKLTAWENGND